MTYRDVGAPSTIPAGQWPSIPLSRYSRAFILLVVTLYIAIFAYEIPQIGMVPVSPKYFVMILGIFVLSVRMGSNRMLMVVQTMPLFIMLYFLFNLLMLFSNPSTRYATMPLEALASYAIICAYSSNGGENAEKVTRIVVVLLVLSALWMILSGAIQEPFFSIRKFLYSGHAQRFTTGELDLRNPTGLTFHHFAMGYQLTCAGVMLPILLLADKRRRLLWSVGCLVVSVAIVLSGQRSVLPAVGLALLLYMICTRRFPLLLLVGVVTGIAYAAVSSLSLQLNPEYDIVMKLQRKDEMAARLGWQMAAMRVIMEHPLGNLNGDLAWVERAMEHGADFSIYNWTKFATHNSYLGSILMLGWGGAILMFLSITHMFKRWILPVLRINKAAGDQWYYLQAVVYALVALMVQALFHNSSIFTVEPVSWITVCLAGGWIICYRNAQITRSVAT